MAQPAYLAALADRYLDTILEASCRAVTWRACSLDEALCDHFADVRETWPVVFDLVAVRIAETDNDDWLPYLEVGGITHD
jgi:hypothetical protein